MPFPGMSRTLLWPLLAAGVLLLAPLADPCATAATAGKAARAASAAVQPAKTVYEGQADIGEAELSKFLADLPQFRAWNRGESSPAHPSVTDGRADFAYSPEAAAWVREHGWDPARFFCVMGRTAAAMTVVSEGSPLRAADMPSVSEGEVALVQRHMAELLKVGSDESAMVQVPPPAKPEGRSVGKPAEFVDKSPRARSVKDVEAAGQASGQAAQEKAAQ